MTKTKKGVDYGKVTPALVKQVKEVIADADKHTYSVSRVYAAHNAAFGLSERPQTCSSCLRNRVRNLREWLAGYEKQAKPRRQATVNEAPAPADGPAGDAATDQTADAPAGGAVTDQPADDLL